MRLEKIQTEKQSKPTPHVARVQEGWAVYDSNNKQVRVFEDIDTAKSYKKRHYKELKEGVQPVVYMSEIMEGVLDSNDDDGWMAKSELYRLAKYAVELHSMIQDTDNLEPWVQSKITKASDYISSVKHYMEYMQATEYTQQVVDDTAYDLDTPISGDADLEGFDREIY